MIIGPRTSLFALGRIVATPGALLALVAAGRSVGDFLPRHALGDWGDLDADDRRRNDDAVTDGGRILSAYSLSDGLRLWIITEADRSVTTLLLPEEY
jgi:hypothetical protein